MPKRTQYEGYSESNVRWAVHKISNEKNNCIIYKNAYTLNPLLNVIPAESEAFVMLEWDLLALSKKPAAC
jgi:hypothetical protein